MSPDSKSNVLTEKSMNCPFWETTVENQSPGKKAKRSLGSVILTAAAGVLFLSLAFYTFFLIGRGNPTETRRQSTSYTVVGDRSLLVMLNYNEDRVASGPTWIPEIGMYETGIERSSAGTQLVYSSCKPVVMNGRIWVVGYKPVGQTIFRFFLAPGAAVEPTTAPTTQAITVPIAAEKN